MTPEAAALFDTVVVVDWSASAAVSPARPSADAIWIGAMRETGVETGYHRTRTAAESHLNAVLDAELRAGRRVLLGFDFPMGYPAGFAARLTGTADVRAVWRWLAENVTDAANNHNNRFAVADRINRDLGGSGPFWGRPASADHPNLPANKRVDYAGLGLSERRAVERHVPRAQPVWKLFTTGSVGSQSLMGLPVVHRLSQLPGAVVWPFDAPNGALVIAEIFPSLLAGPVSRDPGPIKDERQVRLLAQALWRLSQRGQLADLFNVAPGATTAEEGWILGAGLQNRLEAAL